MSMASSGPAEEAVDMAAALSEHSNLALVWHLLYDQQWQASAGSAALWLGRALLPVFQAWEGLGSSCPLCACRCAALVLPTAAHLRLGTDTLCAAPMLPTAAHQRLGGALG